MVQSMKILVQHGQTNIELQVVSEDLVEDVMRQVEAASGVLARQQKLIHRGKVLDSRATLLEANIKDGAKIMLLSSMGGGSSTQVRWHCLKPHLVSMPFSRGSPPKASWRNGASDDLQTCHGQGQIAARDAVKLKAAAAKERAEEQLAAKRKKEECVGTSAASQKSLKVQQRQRPIPVHPFSTVRRWLSDHAATAGEGCHVEEDRHPVPA